MEAKTRCFSPESGGELCQRPSQPSRPPTYASPRRSSSTAPTRCNVDPDYSGRLRVLRTDAPDGLEGHGFTFTIGRGNDVQVAAIDALAPLVVGLDLDELARRHRGASGAASPATASCAGSGPRRASIHLATAAVVNAVWDLSAKRAGMPLWQLLATCRPSSSSRCVDFRYLTDALDRDEALDLLREREPGRAERERALLRDGLPGLHDLGRAGSATTTTSCARWSPRRSPTGLTHIKLKVGVDVADDVAPLRIMREEIGDPPG